MKKYRGSEVAGRFRTMRSRRFKGKTPAEALRGTIKLVNIPWGFQKRLFRVTIPPGVREGTVIRLKGMGRRDAAGVPGDLFLKVSVR